MSRKVIFIISLAVGILTSQAQSRSSQQPDTVPNDTVSLNIKSRLLDEVTVKADRRYVKSTPRGLSVSMAGNPLASIGSAEDALKQMPMIDASSGGISVLGHGTPIIYINKRLMRSNELTTLSSSDIESVEIITNPSSKYGTSVKSVIIIHTRKRNAGLYVMAYGSASRSEEWSESAGSSLNYHAENGITLFGDVSYGFSGFKQKRRYSEKFYDPANPSEIFTTETRARARSRSQALAANAGINYDFGRNAVGLKYSFSRTPKSHYTGKGLTVADFPGSVGEINSVSDLYSSSFRHHVNAFVDFTLPADIELRVDADYLSNHSKSNSGVDEMQTSNVISNTNRSVGEIWAARLALSRTIGKVALEAGAELGRTSNLQDYKGFSTGDFDFLKPESDRTIQNLYAGYVDFTWTISPKWRVFGGVRLESTNTDFCQNGVKIDNLSRSYTDLLPNIGVQFLSPLILSAYYKSRVARPGYGSLDNTYVYVTPTLWETGNPALQPALAHVAGIDIMYKKFILQTSFSSVRRAISTEYVYNPVDRINVSRPVNLPTYFAFQAVAVQQFDFSFWHPTLQGVIYVQNLRYGNPERKYNKPLYSLSLNNRFDLPWGIYAYLNFSMLGSGYQNMDYTKPYWQTSLALSKRWKHFTFTLSANDIFGTWRQKVGTLTNTVDYLSNRTGASRLVALSIRYTLNSAKGRYKGKTSRQDEIDRL